MAEKKKEAKVKEITDVKKLQEKISFLEAQITQANAEKESLMQDFVQTKNRMKVAFETGFRELGSITLEDVNYNLDLMERMLKRRHLNYPKK
jgi:hypothetical protein